AVAGGFREGLVEDDRSPAARNADVSGKSHGPRRAAAGRPGASHLAAPAGRAHALRASALPSSARREGPKRRTARARASTPLVERTESTGCCTDATGRRLYVLQTNKLFVLLTKN